MTKLTKLIALNLQMESSMCAVGPVPDDTMNAMVEEQSAVQYRILAAKCKSWDDLRAKAAFAAWVVANGHLPTIAPRLFQRITEDILLFEQKNDEGWKMANESRAA